MFVSLPVVQFVIVPAASFAQFRVQGFIINIAQLAGHRRDGCDTGHILITATLMTRQRRLPDSLVTPACSDGFAQTDHRQAM